MRVSTFIYSFPQWVASSSCSSSACSSVGSGYDTSSATQTDSNFNITYLQGSVSGPIVWDQVGVGSYTIGNQALGTLPKEEKKNFFLILSCSRCDRRQQRTSHIRFSGHSRPRSPPQLRHRSKDPPSHRQHPRRRSMGLQSLLSNPRIRRPRRSLPLPLPRKTRLRPHPLPPRHRPPPLQPRPRPKQNPLLLPYQQQRRRHILESHRSRYHRLRQQPA